MILYFKLILTNVKANDSLHTEKLRERKQKRTHSFILDKFHASHTRRDINNRLLKERPL